MRLVGIFFLGVLGWLALGCEQERGDPAPFGFYQPGATSEDSPSPESEPNAERTPRSPWRVGASDRPQTGPPLGTGFNQRNRFPRWRPSPGIGEHRVGQRLRRRVVADESVVGLYCLPDRCTALTGAGGIFHTDRVGDWQPTPSTLPPLSRSFTVGAWLVACPASGAQAYLSPRDAMNWTRLEFACGQGGRRTISQEGHALVGQRIAVIEFGARAVRWLSQPLPAPTAIASRSGVIAVFGQEAVAISRDHGETFTLQAGPDNLRQVKDAVVDEKGFIVAVGASDSSESPVAVSRDRGVTWRVAGPLPSRSGACNYATLTADRRLVVSDLDGQCPTTISEDRGVSWRPVDETWPLVGPTADLGAALLAASARGIATLVGGHGLHPLGLREPLRDQLFVDPLHAIGLGRDDGLYRSWNGGRTWHFIPATGGMRYSRLVSNGLSIIAVGDQGLMMSTDGGGSWRPGSLGQACEPEFLAMNDALAFLGCRAGPVLMTEDVGRSWRAVDSLDSVSWMGVSQDGQSFLALSEDRRTISRYRPTSDRWEMALSLASDQVMDVWSSPSGLMLTTDQGELAFLRDEREQPVWLAADSVRRLSNIKQARPLSSGHLLILDQHGLWVWTENSSLRSVLPIQGAHSFTLTGDGGVAISGHTSTQLLSRVRP